MVKHAIKTTAIRPLILPPDDVKWSSIPLKEVLERGARLEANIYDVEGRHAREVLSRCKWDIAKLWSDNNGFVGTASYPGRFKRIYVERGGIPFFMPSQLNELRPKAPKYISPKTKMPFESLKINENEVLLTRSGTIGNCTLASKTLEGKVFSDDVIRIQLKNPNESGYVYAFMKTEIGNTLIQTNNYGAVISHIEPEHLREIPIPNPSPIIKSTVHNLIVDSFRLRDESNELIAEAERLLIAELHLPPIDKLTGKQFDRTAEVQNFAANLSKLDGRLEATFHLPVVHAILAHIKKHAEEITTIGDARISNDIILPGRFKRIYVEEGQGVVFFGGKELLHLDPKGKKFLSLTHHKRRIADQLTIKENMVMVTCSGTIGKVALAPKHWGGWTANQHILRIVPATDELAGYLYIWLVSDYGYELIRRFSYGAVVDEIDAKHMAGVQIPLLKNQGIQNQINALALEANEKRFEAYRLEQEAIQIVNRQVIYTASNFRELVEQWYRDTRHMSSATKMMKHPAYQRIVEMGESAVPLLLQELNSHHDHWLPALNEITGEDPAPEGSNFSEAVEAWLEWGRKKGYLATEWDGTKKLRNVSQN